MPPKKKHKKLGRPRGSKNKRKIDKHSPILRAVKSEDNSIKSENISSDTSGGPCKIIFEDELENHDSLLADEDVDEIVVHEKNRAYYNCKMCPNKNFKFENKFREHLMMEHSTLPGSVACTQCHVICPNKEALADHVIRVHERPVFHCKYCQKQFVRQAHVLRHLAQKGCDGKKVSKFPCEICDAMFTRKDNLIVHLRQMHIHTNFYACKEPQCEFATKNLTKLIRHWHSHHAEKINQFECDICGKATTSRAAMAKHLEIHGEKKYSCDVCGYSTYTIEVMRRHVLTHVEDKPYKCHICSHSYIQRSQLERHLDKHLEHRCDVCGEKVPSKEWLMVHKRKHTGHFNLTCLYSDCFHKKEFTREEDLVHHLETHSVDQMYPCEVCKKQFRSEANMRRHLSTHTLDRPRRCMYCVSARAYVRGVQLVRHVRKFHGEVFRTHLAHVRAVLKVNQNSERVTKSEMDAVLNVLDVESERILEGYSGAGVLYGGMQVEVEYEPPPAKDKESPLMSEEVLAENLRKLLAKLIDENTLQCFGWPDESVDEILEKVIEQCGAKPADRDKWTRVQRLRENAKHLFLHVVDDKNVALMLGTHTIDQIVKHILAQVAEDERTQRRPTVGEVEE